MGHVRLGSLPHSRNWKEVVALLSDCADVDAIASASQKAMGDALKGAGQLPDFREVTYMLAMLPLVARGPEFLEDARALDLNFEQEPTLLELSTAISAALDERRHEVGATTFGEMAQLSLVESLVDAIEPQLPSLFSPEPSEVRTALGRLSNGDRFARLARDFYARLTHRALDFYLSRELANHVGAGERFADDSARRRFDEAMARHCWEVSRIVETYSGGWYGKTVWRDGGLSRESVDRYASYAFTKLRGELGRRHAAK